MSIAAVSWALSLPVPPSPKLTLVAIGQYADADGCCWPFIETLAADTSQSRATVKRRLKELEDANLLTRHARYKDDGGRTSDALRLNLAKKPDEIGTWSVQDCTDPPAQIEPTPGSLVTPLIDEPSIEEESPPKPPQAETQQGSRDGGSDKAQKALERAKQFRGVYPNPSNKPELVLYLLAALTDQEFERVMRGAEGVRARVNANPKRPPAIVSQEKFLRDASLWEEWGRCAPKAPPPRFFETVGSDAWRARSVLADIIRRGEPRPIRDETGERMGFYFNQPLPDHALELTNFTDLPREQWVFVEKDAPDFFAWRDFVRACGYGELDAQNEKIEGEFFEVRMPSGKTMTMPKRRMGIRVPTARPPLRCSTSSATYRALEIPQATGPPQAAE